MRILGLDYGEKRIGVAISDPTGLIARGVEVITRAAKVEEDFQAIKRIIENNGGVGAIVIGLPKALSGQEGVQAGKVYAFIEELKKALVLDVIAWDERLSTVQAERTLISAGLSRAKRKKIIDKSAAMVILQSYLDGQKR